MLPGERRNAASRDGARRSPMTTRAALGPAPRPERELRPIAARSRCAPTQTRHMLSDKIDLLPIRQMLGICKMLHAQILALTAAKTQQLLRDHAGRLRTDRWDRAVRDTAAIWPVAGRAISEQRPDLRNGCLRG